jgi:phospholipase C
MKSRNPKDTSRRESRRRFLTRIGATGAAVAAAPLGSAALFAPRRARAASRGATPIKHVIIVAQENRSFDHYYGYYPAAVSAGYGVPPGWGQPDGMGGTVSPTHLSSPISSDPLHDWVATHAEWDQGGMDGFYTTSGSVALGYYDASDLSYYYGLADQFTLCANYFSSVLGPTSPNRLYLCAGTSGGNTSNNIPPGSLTYPMILDLFAAYNISWKNYRTGLLAELGGDDAARLFARWYRDRRLFNSLLDFLADLRRGTLPQVAFLSPGLLNSEHAPTPITLGISTMKTVIEGVMQSPLWKSTALIFTYDEGGGFFDHVVPPVFDAYGAGMRVPTLVISPYAKRGHVEGALYEHSSILKFVEYVFGLPALASINHEFDTETPVTNNEAVSPGADSGPPAPPRDGLVAIGDLTECFDFS